MDTKHDAKALLDGYANTITGMGTSQDKSRGTLFGSDRYLGWAELSALYEGDAVAARIVKRVVDDATRTKYRLVGTDKAFDWASVQSQVDDLQTITRLGEAWRWGRLYGGALCIMAIDDGRPYSEPVDMMAVRRLNALTVVDSTSVVPVGFVPGLGSRAFAEPEQYEIVVPWGGKSENSLANQRLVHKSRCLRFDGLSLPASRMIVNGGWGPSVLQQAWQPLKRLGSAEGYAENLLHEISVMIFRITGFKELLCGGPGSNDSAKQLLEQLKWGLDNLHVLGLDKEDEFQEIKRSVEGVEKLLDKFVDALVRATDMPRLILLGEQPGGLNSDAKGEVRAWYDHVAAEQQAMLTPRLNRVLEIIFAARRNRSEIVPKEWTVEYDPLYVESNLDRATSASTWATTFATMIMNGICSPDEARAQMVSMGFVEPLTDTPFEVAEDPEAFATPTLRMPDVELGT